MGDLLIARPLDLTRSLATIVNVGAFAGAAAAVAALGMGALAASLPPRGGAAERTGMVPKRKGEKSPHLTFQATSLAAALGGVRGNHVFARLSF